MIVARKFPCPCCGYYTLTEEPPGTYAICPVRYWEDDLRQFEDPDLGVGANRVSLSEARGNFARYGAMSEKDTLHVRPPNLDEYPQTRPRE